VIMRIARMRQRGLHRARKLPILSSAKATPFHRHLNENVAVIGICNCLNMAAGLCTLSDNCLSWSWSGGQRTAKVNVLED
jgi:hypothetical protein